jgi:hypothetical protein
MNIFEILASGNNGLREVHVSSVLGWLLDPYHDHGLGIEVIKRLVSKLFTGTNFDKEIKESEYFGVEIRDRRRIEANIKLEKDVYCKESNNNRIVDIVIEINGKFILAIENKIRVSSKEHGQAMDEISGLLDDSDFSSKELYFIYLVKQDNELIYAAKELENKLQNVFAKPLCWNSNKDELSMCKILQSIILDHNQGKINPVPAETLFLFKSFIRFAENGFSFYKGNVEQNIRKVLFYGLMNEDQSYFVGFQGGIKALKKKLIEAQKNLEEREYLLFVRPYKIRRNPENDNWIKIKEFLELFKENGF